MINVGQVLAEGATAGPIGPVFDVLRELVQKSFAFNPTLESVKSRVCSLDPLMSQIEDLNKALGGSRQAEVEKLKTTMEGGISLIGELLKVNEWSCLKTFHTDKLNELDMDLKRHLEILQVQGLIDVKETLVVAKENTQLAEKNISQVEKLEGIFEAGLAVIRKRQDEVLDQLKGVKTDWIQELNGDLKGRLAEVKALTNQLKYNRLENKVGSLNEAAALEYTIFDLKDKLDDAIEKQVLTWSLTYVVSAAALLSSTLNMITTKIAKNEEICYVPTEVLHSTRLELEEGIQVIDSCSKVLEWTDVLKSEYTIKFLRLNKTLEILYNRLNGIQPFIWNAGRCGGCCGTMLTNDSDIMRDHVSLYRD